MVYGFPLNTSDADCDTEPLDPSDPWSIAADGQLSSSGQPSLLLFKCSMSELSRIVKTIIEELYSFRQSKRSANSDSTPHGPSARIQAIVKKVAVLNARLSRWHSRLPSRLKLEKFVIPHDQRPSDQNKQHRTNIEQESLASGFEEHLFRLQAISLKLAFENARILIHRPLLSYKVMSPSGSSSVAESLRHDPSSAAIDICRDAALQISCAGSMPVFKEATTTYAANFIYLHILTAGVTLCIMASINPLSRSSLESKLGIRRLMQMQVSLKSDSVVANQGFQLLRKLFALVMKKETDMMLTVGDPGNELSDPNDSSRSGLSSSDPTLRVEEDLVQSGVHPTVEGIPHSTVLAQDFQDTISMNTLDTIESCSFSEDALMTQTMLDIEQG